MPTNVNLLRQYKNEIDTQINTLTKRLALDTKERTYIQTTSYITLKIKEEITEFLKELDFPDLKNPVKIALPPAHVNSDITMSVFEFSKTLKKSPAAISDEVSKHINSSKGKKYIASASPSQGYVNMTLNRTAVYGEVVSQVAVLGDQFGTSDIYKGKTVVIDYSAPNIAKPFGVGHLRSTVIGEALARIYNAVGFTVVKDNHLGDWGTQFGALIHAYKMWGDDAVIEKNPIEELKNLYVRFNDEVKDKPEIKDEARKIFADLENGNPELMALWKRFRDLSLKEFEKIYKKLNVSFDIAIGESYYTDDAEKIVEEIKKKSLAQKTEEGAVIVEDLDGLPTFLIQKSDGSTLYVLRDIQTLIHRKEIFNPDIVLYVVGAEQKLNFRQFFALAKAAGYAGDTDLQHIDFGMVLLEGKKMSTRKGRLVNLEEVIDEAIIKAREILIEKKREFSKEEVENIATAIGTSAIVYSDLKQNRLSNIEFDWDKMLSLEAGSVVYLHYTHARILSILTKAGYDFGSPVNNKDLKFETEQEFKVTSILSFYPDTIERAFKENSPHLIALYLDELTTAFNNFYSHVQVLTTSDEELKNSRLHLLRAVSQTIKNALNLLNIKALTKI